MSIFDSLASKPLIEAEEPQSDSLFEFTATDKTEQEVRDKIHERFGLVLVNPSTIEPDKFNQAYSHLLPQGFTFNPEVVESIRVYYDESETEFAIIPFKSNEMQIYSFRVSQNHSNHYLVPPELLLHQDSVKMVA